jgi:DNA modification methylase
VIHYESDRVTVHHGDCLDVLRELDDNSVDAVCTDPPYGLSFMSKEWDRFAAEGRGSKVRQRRAREVTQTGEGHSTSAGPYLAAGVDDTRQGGHAFQAWCQQWAAECLRVLKPGGHLLAFGGTRTWHRLACAIEDAGFEVRDSLAYMYGSGFPKSLDVSKAIDKARNDKADVLAVTTRLAELAALAEIGRADIDAHMGTSDMGGWWLSTLPHRCACPSVENWTRLRQLIPGADELDAEVWRLNGRKGTPGEAWSQREKIGKTSVPVGHAFAGSTYGGDSSEQTVDITAPATPGAARWQGWGTALKPAYEPVVLARKPLSGTVASNVLAWGTGALNVDGCRVEGDVPQVTQGLSRDPSSWEPRTERQLSNPNPAGRWPANVLLDHEAAAMLDEQSGERASGWRNTDTAPSTGGVYGDDARDRTGPHYADLGGASRFFKVVEHECEWCNAINPERTLACTYLPGHDGRHEWDAPTDVRFRYTAKADAAERPRANGVAHPTVKPLDLMRWLVRLITPPGGIVLEPFAGSGATVEACILEGFRCIAIEREADYLPLIMQRIHRQTDPVAHHELTKDDDAEPSLFDLLGGDAA